MGSGDGVIEDEPRGPADPVDDDQSAGRRREVDDDRDRHRQRSERLELLRQAAIQAEYATGRHEETEEEARRGVIRRVGTIIVGFVVLFGGIAMMILPGPGILGIIAGLAILAQELAWAERLLEYVKKRAKIDELQEQPRWVQAVMWTITAAAVIGSMTYFLVIR